VGATAVSVAVVPVGLTPNRRRVIPVSRERREVIQVRSLQDKLRVPWVYFVWLADEWFLIAGQELPPESEYEDHPQIDNGVGSIRSSSNNFLTPLSSYRNEFLHHDDSRGWATPWKSISILHQLNSVVGLEVNMCALCSDYWGQTITVQDY